MAIDNFVPELGGVDAFELVLKLVVDGLGEVGFGEGVGIEVKLVVGDLVFEFFPGEAFFFSVPDETEFSKKEAGIDTGEVEFFGEEGGGSGLAGAGPFASNYNRKAVLLHGWGDDFLL